MEVSAVKPTVHMRQVVIGIADPEITPEAVAIIFFQLDIELATGRRIFHDRAVIAEGREMIIRVDTPEQRLRRLLQEVAEDLVQRPFARIGAGSKPPAVAELAFRIEGKPSLGVKVIAVLRSVRCDERGRAGGLVGRQGQVGDAHREPVVLL